MSSHRIRQAIIATLFLLVLALSVSATRLHYYHAQEAVSSWGTHFFALNNWGGCNWDQAPMCWFSSTSGFVDSSSSDQFQQGSEDYAEYSSYGNSNYSTLSGIALGTWAGSDECKRPGFAYCPNCTCPLSGSESTATSGNSRTGCKQTISGSSNASSGCAADGRTGPSLPCPDNGTFAVDCSPQGSQYPVCVNVDSGCTDVTNGPPGPKYSGGCIENNGGKVCYYSFYTEGASWSESGSAMSGRTNFLGCQASSTSEFSDEFHFCSYNYSAHTGPSEHDIPGVCSYWSETQTDNSSSGSRVQSFFRSDSCDDFDKCTTDLCGANGNCEHFPVSWCNQAKHAICSNNSCITVDGSGQDECGSDQDCQGSHTICQGDPATCQSVSGNGKNECYSSSDCGKSHTVCIDYACQTVQGPGRNECGSDWECKQHHSICSENQCIIVDGAGDNKCRTDSECDNRSHSVCNASKNCESVQGPGPNECGSSNDCQGSHTVCQGTPLACVSVQGDGINECGSSSDCDSRHNACAGQQCQSVSGPGPDGCGSSNDCKNDSHTICSGLHCLTVSGAGKNQCYSDFGCQVYHTVCQGFSCASVPGDGTSECYSSSDCKHTVCQNSSCKTVSGKGKDKCASDVQCTGTECQGMVCVPTSNPGVRECSNNLDCSYMGCTGSPISCTELTCTNPPCTDAFDVCDSSDDCGATHTVCSGYSCTTVSGQGKNQCQSNNDCQHDVCIGQQCTTKSCIPPDCADSCQTTSDCTFNKCQGAACMLTTEPLQPGERACTSDWDCGSHTACNASFQCVPVWGPPQPGEKACLNNHDCTTHLECVGSSCQALDGYGENQCASDKDCSDTVCNYTTSQCDTTAGTGVRECESFSDCTHLECNGSNSCARVPGSSVDTCSTEGSSCTVQHTECQTGFCAVVPGSGTNQCQRDTDCQHTECSEKACQTVLAQGTSTCAKNSSDCFYNACTGQGLCETTACPTKNSCNSALNECATSADCQNGISGIYIESLSLAPAAFSRSESLASISGRIKNVSNGDCANGVVTLGFLKENGESLGFTPCSSAPQTFAKKSVSDVSFSADNCATIANTATLNEGLYLVEARLYCSTSTLEDSKSQSFMVQANYFAVPETQFGAVLLLLAGAATALFAGSPGKKAVKNKKDSKR